LSNEELIELRSHLQSGSEETIALGGHSFRLSVGSLFFGSGKNPSKYYLEMTRWRLSPSLTKHCADDERPGLSSNTSTM
jgi:hypothetical protein